MIFVRKYIIGGIVGFMMAFAVSAHAEVISMIGKVIQGEYDFTVDNQKLEYKAIIVDGTAYIPARLTGDNIGYIVRFDETTGLKMIKKIVGTSDTVNKSIEAVQQALFTNERMTSSNEAEVVKLRKEEQNTEIVTRIKNSENELERLRKSNENLKNQINILNQTLVEISAQEAELNPPSQPAPTQP